MIEMLANTIRVLSAEAVEKAKSGHPGMPMGMADVAAVLWAKHLRFNPKDTSWANRDRFLLSAGHGSMLLYSLLHLFGFDLSMEELKQFRQWGSRTPGHPEFGVTPGVEITSGPLGQGFANGVGMAIAGKKLAAMYGAELFNYRIFGIVSDGDLMEGISYEAASIAGHLKLDNIVYIYDDNKISIAGSTELAFTEDVGSRFRAQGWWVTSIDGHNLNEIDKALTAAAAIVGQPKLIMARTTIAKGSPNKAGKSSSHGEPLGADELAKSKELLGFGGRESFTVPPEVGELCCNAMVRNVELYQSWQKLFASSGKSAELSKHSSCHHDPGLIQALQQLQPKKDATRSLSGDVIQIIAKHCPNFIGGSADLEPSTKTLIKDSADFTVASPLGSNLRFGVREHAMGAIANGLAYTKYFIPYTATFLVFADYMRPAIRLAALSHLKSIFIFTHDSFWVGEDGPTHQPIEHIAALRLIPNLHVYRPADMTEVASAYRSAISRDNGPSAILLTRQTLDPISREANFDSNMIMRGAYFVKKAAAPQIILVATGSEVQLAIGAAAILEQAHNIVCSVVSMSCQELFKAQPAEYIADILPANVFKVSIEAGVTTGWERFVDYSIGLDRFGASAPGGELAKQFGFTADRVAEVVRGQVNM